MFELANQSRVSGVSQTEAKILEKNRAAAVGYMRTQMSFLSIKASKPALVVTKK